MAALDETVTEDEFDLAYERWGTQYAGLYNEWNQFIGQFKHYIDFTNVRAGYLMPMHYQVKLTAKGKHRIQLLNSPHWKALLKAMEIQDGTSQ